MDLALRVPIADSPPSVLCSTAILMAGKDPALSSIFKNVNLSVTP